MKRAGIREQLEIYMTQKNIDILFIQETKINRTYMEKMKNPTIYYAGDETRVNEQGKQDQHTEAGAAIMINNKLVSSINIVEPEGDRQISITLHGTVQYTFINTYNYTAKDAEKNWKYT